MGSTHTQEAIDAMPTQAPEVTARLFQMGSEMLLQHMDAILSGRARQEAVPQDDARATYAHKVGQDWTGFW